MAKRFDVSRLMQLQGVYSTSDGKSENTILDYDKGEPLMLLLRPSITMTAFRRQIMQN